MKYQSKEPLIKDIRTEHDSLCARLREIPKVRRREKTVWGDGWTVSGLAAHWRSGGQESMNQQGAGH